MDPWPVCGQRFTLVFSSFLFRPHRSRRLFRLPHLQALASSEPTVEGPELRQDQGHRRRCRGRDSRETRPQDLTDQPPGWGSQPAPSCPAHADALASALWLYNPASPWTAAATGCPFQLSFWSRGCHEGHYSLTWTPGAGIATQSGSQR